MKNRIIRFHITPETYVRATANDRIFFRIPRDKLYPSGLKRLQRLEKYNKYKLAVELIAKSKKFVFPPQGATVRFYVPCPRTWSKKKKKQYHGSIHQQKPDLSNLYKAFEDGLMSEDKHIAHVQISKHWVDFERGWIEIEISQPQFPTIILPNATDRDTI